MSRKTPERHFTEALRIITEMALEGKRAPTNQYTFPTCDDYSGTTLIGRLIKDGYLRSETYAHNWRVLEIMSGQFKGARTMAAPYPGPPYKVVDHPEMRELGIEFPTDGTAKLTVNAFREGGDHG